MKTKIIAPIFTVLCILGYPYTEEGSLTRLFLGVGGIAGFVFSISAWTRKSDRPVNPLAENPRVASLTSQSSLRTDKDIKASTPAQFGAVMLAKAGDRAPIPIKNLQVTLQWTAAVDLDLHAFFKTKLTAPQGTILNPLVKWLQPNIGKPGSEAHVFYFYKGKRIGYPWMRLDKDAGIGDFGGKNQENLYFSNLQHLEHVLIAVNIFWKPLANFARYDGRVIVKCDRQRFEVPLTATEGGNWCIVAHVDNSGDSGPVLINVNKVQRQEPTIASFLESRQ